MTTRIVAYVPDLMDRSRVAATRPDVDFVATPAELAGSDADLVLVDVSRPGVLDVVSELTAPVIGFAPHVDDTLLTAGRAAGCTEALPRSKFFRRLGSLS